MDKSLEGETPKYQPLILEKDSTPRFKVFSVEDSELANDDLLRLVDDKGVQSIKSNLVFNDKKLLSTEVGDIQLNIRYRPEYSDLYITSAETEISGLSLRIRLNELGKPQQIILIDDLNNFFATLFSETGFTVFNTLGPSNKTSLQSFIEKRSRIQQIDTIYRDFTTDMSKKYTIDRPYQGQDGFFVTQGLFRVDKINVPLATAGLNTCSALVVISNDKKLHYLAHIDSNVSEEEINKSLTSFDLDDSEIFIMGGPYPSSVPRNIIGSIINSPGLNNLKFISTSEQGIFQGITSYNGELYFAPLPSERTNWGKEASSFQDLSSRSTTNL